MWARDGIIYNSDLQKHQAEYFCIQGLTRFPKIGTDLPGGLICRRSECGCDFVRMQITAFPHARMSRGHRPGMTATGG
jgi:hypothetical protein